MKMQPAESSSEQSPEPGAGEARGRRGSWWFWGLLVGVPVLLLAVAYAVLAYQYYSQSVRITKNYAAELNAPILAVPEEQRAWTHYRRALEMLEREPAVENGAIAYAPGEVNWESTIEYLRRNRRALDAIRKAAAMRPMGCLRQDAPAREDIEWRLRHGEMTAEDAAAVGSPSENPDLMDTLIATHWFRMFSLGRLLAADGHLAVIERDGERVVANVNALLDCGSQVQERSFLVDYLIGATIRDKGFDLALSALANEDAPLTDDQLSALAKRLAGAYEAGPVRVSFDGEHIFFLDLMQRNFTDDGAGDGWITPRGLAEVDSNFFGEEPQRPAGIGWLPMPIAARMVASRRESEEKYDECLSQLRRVMSVPLWQRSRTGELFENDPELGRPGFWLISSTIASVEAFLTSAEQQTQRRDALMVAIALVRHHRRHAKWPSKLSELSPEFLKSVPPDRFDGRALRYRVVGGRPLLYSIGTDLDDDGGKPVEGDSDTDRADSWPPNPAIDGDWVFWPPVEYTPLVRSSAADPESTGDQAVPLARPPEPAIDGADIELNDIRVEAPESAQEACR